MADSTVASLPPPKRRGWLRVLLWAAGVVAALLVVVYFVATSSAFFKGVILPRVSAAINAEVTVSDASIHPFNQVVLRNLKVQPKGQQPLVIAPEVSLSYSLMDILQGNLHADDITLDSPTVELVQKPDGTSNLDPILKALQTKPSEQKPPQPAKPSKPVQIDLRKLTLSNATLLKIKEYKGGARDLVEVTNLNVTLANVKNGQAGTLELSAAARVENNPPAPGTNGLLEASVKGNFNFALTGDLKPASAKGELHLDVSQAGGAFSDFAALGAALNCDLTPTDIKEVALRFSRGDSPLGELRVDGPFDAGKMEGRLNVNLLHMDRQVLNLAGAKSGIDFGSTTINSTNQIQLSKAGAAIAANGQFSADKFQLTRNGQTTPALDFRAAYDVTVDRAAQTASLRKLTLVATQAGNSLLNAKLTEPMNLAWGNGANAVGNSSLELAVEHLNLAEWKPFIGGIAPTGTVGLTLKLASQQGGKHLAFDLSSEIANLTARLGSNSISQADINLEAQGQAADLKQFRLSAYKLQVALQKQPALTVSGTADYNLADGSADAQVRLQAALARLAQVAPQPGLSVSSGTAEINLHASQKQKTQTFDLTSAISDLSAKFGGNEISQAGIHLEARGQAVDARQVSLSAYQLHLSLQNQSALEASGSGSYDLADGSADMQVKLQAALARLLQAFPQPGVSISSGDVGLTAHVMRKDKAQTVTGDLALSNFTGQIGKNDFRNYASSINLDVANSPAQILIRKVAGSLSQGGNTGGNFEVSGSYLPAAKSADLNIKLADLNQNAVRPFLEPMLANKKLASVDINAALSAQYVPQGASTVKGDLQVTNLVVNDPQQQFPATPLAVKLQVDTSLQKQTADVRQLQVTLTPTDRAQNQLQLQGHVDFSQTTNIQGNLRLTADSLDMTRYYDLFAGKPKPAAAQPATSTPTYAPAQPASSPNHEPAPIILPFHDFTASADIGKFYLHDLEITNLLANVTLNGGQVLVKPIQLALNGAPVNATANLNLGVPGWVYDVSLNASRIPVLPLANTFVADANGKYNGFVSATAQIKGKGVTGTNLKQNLNGSASLTLSDANIQLIASQTKIFFIPINIKLIATLLNIPEIMQSPLTGANVKLNFGNGQIDVQQAEVVSPAFLGNVHGVVPIADVLNDSPLNLPVEVSLKDSLASKLSLNNPQTASTAGFTQLPVFLTVEGTIGNPEYKKNTLILASLTAQAAGGLVGGEVGNAIKAGGGVVQGLESLFGKHNSSGGNQSTNTNTSTNAVKKFNPFDLFKR